jgi:hypothetical protein
MTEATDELLGWNQALAYIDHVHGTEIVTQITSAIVQSLEEVRHTDLKSALFEAELQTRLYKIDLYEVNELEDFRTAQDAIRVLPALISTALFQTEE